MARCLLIGNYGVGNIGDEALRQYMLQRFPEVEWQVLSARPGEGELPRLPLGIRSFVRTPWWRTLGAMRRADAVVFGGGTLFTDGESLLACFLWGWHVLAARLLGKPVLLAFQGIGPFRTRTGEWIARKVVSAAAFVSLRDPLSLARVDLWDLNKEIILTFDPVLTIIPRENIERSHDVLILVPRRNSGRTFLRAIDEVLEFRRFPEIVIASLQPDDPGEREACATCLARCPGSRIVEVRSLEELGRVMSGARLVLTHRYHGAIAALALGREVILCPQAADDKLSSLEPLFALPPSERFALLRERVRTGELRLHEALGRIG